jgi:hypothetical protein
MFPNEDVGRSSDQTSATSPLFFDNLHLEHFDKSVNLDSWMTLLSKCSKWRLSKKRGLVADVWCGVRAIRVKECVRAIRVKECVPASRVKECVPASRVKECVPASRVKEGVRALMCLSNSQDDEIARPCVCRTHTIHKMIDDVPVQLYAPQTKIWEGGTKDEMRIFH